MQDFENEHLMNEQRMINILLYYIQIAYYNDL